MPISSAESRPILEPFSRVLVTGGLGFIGAALVRSLWSDGHRVTVLDDGSGGETRRLDDLREADRLEVVSGSVLDRPLVEGLVARHDTIFHLAAVVGVRRVLDDPHRTWRVNAIGASTVIESVSRQGRRLVLFSSSEVYGPGSSGPLDEQRQPRVPAGLHPRWIYARAKRFAERLALQHQRCRGLRLLVVRPFNVVGPEQAEESGMVLPSFVGRASRGEPLLVHGDGRQRRVFLHLEDCVRLVRALAASRAAAGRIVNVGGIHEISIEELARRVVVILGSPSLVRHVPHVDRRGRPVPDFPERRPQLGLLYRLTGLEPQLDLERMIRDASAGLRFAQPCRLAN